MSRVRITCRAPEPMGQTASGISINGCLPSISDCDVTVDGERLNGVESVEFKVACDNKPVRVVLTLSDVDLDVETNGASMAATEPALLRAIEKRIPSHVSLKDALFALLARASGATPEVLHVNMTGCSSRMRESIEETIRRVQKEEDRTRTLGAMVPNGNVALETPCYDCGETHGRHKASCPRKP